MPNWTKNVIICDDENVLKSIVNEKGEVDFNIYVPMPLSLNLESGTITSEAITYFLTERLTLSADACRVKEYLTKAGGLSNSYERSVLGIKKSKLTMERADNLYDLGRQYVENCDKYGYPEWYSWSYANWGVKWNASDSEVSENEVSFYTPWNAPVPILQMMCKKFPETEIQFFQYDEDGQYYESMNTDGTFETVASGYSFEDDEEVA